MRLHPTGLLVTICALPLGLSLVLVAMPTWWPVLAAIDAALVLLVTLDAVLGTPRRLAFAVDCECREVWSHYREESVLYHLDSRGRRSWSLTIVPDHPPEFAPSEPREILYLPGKRRADLSFQFRPHRRGDYRLHGLHLSCASALRFWRRSFRLGPERRVRVYPNLRQIADYALLARTDRLSLIGVRRLRQIGGDTEFERLRDYHSDDPLGRIDWKATARRDELTVRDYQINQSQSIVLMIDAGRMMVSRYRADGEDAGSLFDLAINAGLLLAYVALHQGDRVGLIAYADGIKRYVPARGGTRHLNQLIHALHDLEPDLVESRHNEAFIYLEHRERKRSLAVLLTHVLDDVNADMLEKHLANLSRRHLPLAVLLRDPDVHEPLTTPPENEADFWHTGAAACIAAWRDEALTRLRNAGALTIDVAADRLTASMVSRYLEIKAEHLL